MRAVAVPLYKMGLRAQMIGRDELLSEALAILTECALPPREQLRICAYCEGPIPESVRKGAKYCTPKCSSSYRDARTRANRGEAAAAKRVEAKGHQEQAPAHPKTHIGSMHTWPADEMFAYAVREVGFRLCHFVSHGRLETPSTGSAALVNLEAHAVGESDAAEEARELLAVWFESKGIRLTGDETVDDLREAAINLGAIQREYA